MSIMELGALGEFVASMVVLVTLVYLAVQMRQAKEVAEQSAVDSRNRSAIELFMGTATSEHLAPALVKAQAGLGGGEDGYDTMVRALISDAALTPDEAMRVFQFCGAMTRNHQSIYRSNLPGVELESFDANLRSWYSTPLGEMALRALSIGLSPDFKSHVDGLLAKN